jgi:hypothetical protein
LLFVGLSMLLLVGFFVWPGRASRPGPSTDGAVRVETLPVRLKELPQRFAAGAPLSRAGEVLAEMAKALDTSPRAEAVAALLAVLDSGADAPTGLVFKVGSGGVLVGAPTLRVWMLDQLGRIDRLAAARYAARIYERHGSADEWAIALRNDWREAAPSGRIETVRARALELLADTEWTKQASIGFLEALDLTVATTAWEAVPRLEQWLGSAHPEALRAGAWIALDRLTLEAPEDFLPALVQHRDWLASQPLLRAGLMARADLDVGRERQAAEIYLERDDLTAMEGKRFFELVPHVSATVSHNLVTSSRSSTPQRAATLDRAALAGVRKWRADARFSRWNAELAAAEIRLSESVASAVRGGYLQP